MGYIGNDITNFTVGEVFLQKRDYVFLGIVADHKVNDPLFF